MKKKKYFCKKNKRKAFKLAFLAFLFPRQRKVSARFLSLKLKKKTHLKTKKFFFFSFVPQRRGSLFKAKALWLKKFIYYKFFLGKKKKNILPVRRVWSSVKPKRYERKNHRRIRQKWKRSKFWLWKLRRRLKKKERKRRFLIIYWRKSRLRVFSKKNIRFIFFRKKYYKKNYRKYLRSTTPFNTLWYKKNWPLNIPFFISSYYSWRHLARLQFLRQRTKIYNAKELRRLNQSHAFQKFQITYRYKYFLKSMAQTLRYRKKKRLKYYRYMSPFNRYTYFRLRTRWRYNALLFQNLVRVKRWRWLFRRRYRKLVNRVSIMRRRYSFSKGYPPLYIRQKKETMSLKHFFAINPKKFQNYYKLILVFKKFFLNAYGLKKKQFPSKKRMRGIFRKSRQYLVTYNYPDKRKILFLTQFEFSLPTLLNRFFFLKNFRVAKKLIQTHGILVNNVVNTRVRTRGSISDIIECSLKSYLYYEPYFWLGVSLRSSISWIYNYAFVVNCTYLVGSYYRLPIPLYTALFQVIGTELKKRFFNFYIHYCHA